MIRKFGVGAILALAGICSVVSAEAGLNESTFVSSVGEPFRALVAGESLVRIVSSSVKHVSSGGWLVSGGFEYTSGGHTYYEGYIEKLTAERALDVAFDGIETGNGIVRVSSPAGTELGGMDVQVSQQASGKIIAAWTVKKSAANSVVRVARYTSDGTLDASFGTAGYFDFSYSSGPSTYDVELKDLIVLGSQSIVVLAQAKTSPHRVVLKVLDTNGGNPAQGEYVDGAYSVYPNTIVEDAYGRVLVSVNTSRSAVVVRFSSAAVRDNTFGASGKYEELNANTAGDGTELEYRNFRSMVPVGTGLFLLRASLDFGTDHVLSTSDDFWRCGIVAITNYGDAWTSEASGADFDTAHNNNCYDFARVSTSDWIVTGARDGHRALWLLNPNGALKTSGNDNFPSGIWTDTSSSAVYERLASYNDKFLLAGKSGNSRLRSFFDFSVPSEATGASSSSSDSSSGGAFVFLAPLFLLLFRRKLH